MTRRLLSFAVAALVLMVAGCSSDDSADTTSTTSVSPSTTTVASTSTSSSTTSPTTNATTDPATTEPSAPSTTSGTEPLETTIQDLLDRYDAAVTTILTDPSVTTDPASPAVTTYLALFAPGSTFAQGALTSWAQDAANGRSYRPGPSGSMIDTSLVGLTSTSESEAAFTACAANSLQVIDSAGNVISSSGGVTFVQAVAELVDGQWLLRDLSQSSGDCPEQGSGG
jgi:hypothetical protein